MNIKSLVPVHYSLFRCRISILKGASIATTLSQKRCMAVHVGTGETGRIERKRDNMEFVLAEKERECEKERENELRIGFHYEAMLRSDPLNPLLLRNYGQFMHEVVGDVEKAEECYERAILASPVADGELLAMYGKLVWEERGEKEKERAERYMEAAVQASPHDCYVAGAYAHFLWDSEEDDQNPIS